MSLFKWYEAFRKGHSFRISLYMKYSSSSSGQLRLENFQAFLHSNFNTYLYRRSNLPHHNCRTQCCWHRHKLHFRPSGHTHQGKVHNLRWLLMYRLFSIKLTHYFFKKTPKDCLLVQIRSE